MNSDGWRRIEELYHAACARPARERPTFLDKACGGDVWLRQEVESLLAQPVSTDGFLERPELLEAESTKSMAVATGTQLGAYEIAGLIGAGGMGEVYRARDMKLGRDVAIKVLPSCFANDPDRLARLSREARLLAALNHQHIATIHGLEEADGVRALVMELVEGPTLAEILTPGSRRKAEAGLPLAEALKIGGQIAEALEAAHEKGVIHGDLKPANIKLSHDGNVKVLDFGLAKAFSSDGTGNDLSHLPTITSAELQTGAIAGTPAYMSPEQARGQAIDKRTDIWGFGCVLYEMLTGRAAFRGETISDTIAAILDREPEWGTLPAHTPAGIQQLLRRCLDKDSRRRLRDIGDARIEIDDNLSGLQPNGRVAQAPARSRRWPTWAWGLALITLIVTAIGGVWALRPAPTSPQARLEINTPPTGDPSVAISPDGLKIVFVAESASQSLLWLRSLDSPQARLLSGTEHGSRPFWSPDSRSIGFFADASLKRMNIDGGSAQTLAVDIAVALGGAWNREGTIVFSRSPGGPILRVPAGGGEPAAATRIESPQQRGHSFPTFLPDGRHFLFFVTGSPEARGIYIGQLGGFDTTRLFDADTPAAYTSNGYLLFVRQGKLLAQGFDPNRLELKGASFPIAESVTEGTALSASAVGLIAYRTGYGGQRQLSWVDRAGRETGKEVYADTSALGPSLSPDGRRVAVYRQTSGNMDIWSYESNRRTWDRLTFDPGDDIFPLWSRDGTSIVYGAVRNSERVVDLYRKVLSAPQASEELLLSTLLEKFPMDWSPDGRFLLYTSLDPTLGSDIWALPLENRKPFEVVRTSFSEGLAQFSPDGRWIAYQSNKTGRFEIYLRPFPGPGEDWRASVDGGTQARWNPNGAELFYIGTDDRLMAVPISFSSNDTIPQFGEPLGLFVTSVGSPATPVYRQQYVVSGNGQSFVMNSAVGVASASPITVILNWTPKDSR